MKKVCVTVAVHNETDFDAGIAHFSPTLTDTEPFRLKKSCATFLTGN
jgi:hypothetical protein